VVRKHSMQSFVWPSICMQSSVLRREGGREAREARVKKGEVCVVYTYHACPRPVKVELAFLPIPAFHPPLPSSSLVSSFSIRG